MLFGWDEPPKLPIFLETHRASQIPGISMPAPSWRRDVEIRKRGGAAGCLIGLSKWGVLQQEKGVWFVHCGLAKGAKPMVSGAFRAGPGDLS